MKLLIRALAIATLLQIGATSCLTFFMIDHSANAAREFSLQIEQRANEHTGAVVLDMYNRLERQRNTDRDEMHNYIDQAISLRLTRAGLPLGLQQEPQ